jgi:hypothetical protein
MIPRGEISGLKQNRVFCLNSQTIHGPKGNAHGTTDGFAATLPLEVSAILPVARIRLGTAWRALVDGQRHAAGLKECEICGLAPERATLAQRHGLCGQQFCRHQVRSEHFGGSELGILRVEA